MTRKSLLPLLLAFSLPASADTVFDPTLFDRFAPFAVTGYAGTTELEDFPVLVRLAAGSPAGFDYADCAPDGSDIRFADSDDNLIPHEIDTWNPEGESLIWVRVPVVADGTAFTMYFGSSDAMTLSDEDVWSRYAAVVHGGTALTNAVAGGPAVTAGSNAVTAEADAGRIGGGIRKSAYKSIGVNVAKPSDALAASGRFSVSGWFKRDGDGGSNGNGTFILGASRPGWKNGTGFLWLQEQGSYISVAANDSHQFSSGNHTLPKGEWGYAAFAYESGVSLTTWFNGAQDNRKTAGVGNLASTAATWTFGSYQDTASDDSFAGDMDELRIFDGVASGDWIKAEYDTVANASFLAAGAVKTIDPDAPRITGGSVVEDVRRLDVSFACSMSGATVSYRFAKAGDDIGEATPVVLTSDSVADETVSFSLTGLEGDAVYTVVVDAAKDGHAAFPWEATASPFGADVRLVPSAAASHVRTRAGADEVHVLGASGTFTLSARRRVRLLAVGGGGGAGWASSEGGGGGGAGGMLEISNVVLRAGTYRYEVGAGGAPGRTDGSKGENGGDTVLWFVDPVSGDETEIARAFGGGGSGCHDNRHGKAGGSGGGAVYRGENEWGNPGAGTSGQGNAGGGWTSKPSATVASSGGGGAGAPGETGTATKGGDGGDGLPSDITGAEVWFAGGGGASTRNNNATARTIGRGGRGGGGHGADYGHYTTDPGRDGVDGLGGGGGGGLAWYIASGPSKWYNCFGGRGGSGTLVLRFAAAPAAEPVLAGVTATLKDARTAVFSGTVEWVGDGASAADLVLAAGGASETVATGLATGADFSFETDVEPGSTFSWSLKLVNSVNVESAAVSDSIAVPADVPVAIAATGAELRSVGIDTVAIFTNTAAAGSFTVPAGGAWVEMLVVGGGGAGGVYWDSHGGAGGGAGGFVHEPALFLEEGVYTVTVGEGGKGREDGSWDGNGWPGKPGLPSFVQHGGADVARALGGSGGASRYSGNCTNYYAGSPSFASTGGAMPVNTSNVGYLDVDAQPGTPGQGNPGGAGRRATISNSSGSGTYLFAGGGGGAGARGGAGDPVAMAFGDGGDGLPCSITGEEVWYAGGGGCGSAYKAPGSLVAAATKGGRGGGGYGQRWQSATDPDNRGVNGLGGGGGGGGGKDGNSNGAANCPSGHSGGSGTVIVRWRSMSESAIVVELGEPVGGFRRGTFSGTVTAAGGDGATVDVEIGVAPAGAATTNWTTVATGLAAGDAFSASVDGLADGTEYVAAWRATNGSGGTAAGDAGAFATFAGAYLVPGSEAAGATVTQVGNDSVYTYSNPATAGSFTVL